MVIFSVSFSIYCYSNLRVGLEEKAKTTTDFFGNYISQSYNEYYQSCIRFAQTFEEKNNLELQFISTSGKIVASSYGQWAGQAPETSDIADAIATGEISHFMGRNPHTGERILAVSSPMIYVNGEVIGVLRYVTSLRNVDKQIVMAVGIAVLLGILFIAFVLYSSRFFIRSILEPVSTSAVAIIVRLPASSVFLADEKICRGRSSARISSPPVIVLPPFAFAELCARERRVMESIKSTTSLPTSTRCFARSRARSRLGQVHFKVCDFLRAFVHEQNHEMAFGVV